MVRPENLRITLKYEGKLHHIDSPFPNPFVANATPEQVASYQTLFAEEEKFALLNACKMEDSQSISSYVLKMKSYIDKLERLRHPVPHVLAGMRSTRTLEKDVMVLHMGNGSRAEVEAIGFYFLNVPSGMELEDNPTNVVVQAPPQNQENDVTPVLRISGRASHPLMRYYGYLIDSDVRDLGDHEEPKT
ncbi:hypothetical protein Tco_0465943 [Tanacetum coccineum]